MIELFSADTPNGKKISIMLEEIGYEYKVTKVALGKPLIVIDENSNDEFQADVVVKLAKEKFLSAGSDAKAFDPNFANPTYSEDINFKKLNE